MTTSHFSNQGLDSEADLPLTDEQVEEITAELYKEASGESKPRRNREHEHSLVHAFKKAQTPDTFMPLYKEFKPLIMTAARKNMFGSPLPQAAHEMYAAQSFLDATRTWDEKKGAFSTHAFNTVTEKGKRLNPKYQNIGYIPEARAMKYQNYQNSNYILKEELGRPPSAEELADHMSLNIKDVKKLTLEMRKDFLAKDHIPMAGPSFAQSNKAMQLAYDIYPNLIGKHQIVMERMLGMHGHEAMTKKGGTADVAGIARALNLTVGDVESAKKTITKKIQQHQGSYGRVNEISFETEDEN